MSTTKKQKISKGEAYLPTIIKWVESKGSPLTEEEQAACLAAFDPKSGYLLAKMPSGLPGGAWVGLQPNVHKVNVRAAMRLPREAQELAGKLSTIAWPPCFDRDADALNKMGVWF
jgi:hypothetical protein